LHLAAQHGLIKLIKTLTLKEEDGGFGADGLKADLVNQRAIHYAIAFK